MQNNLVHNFIGFSDNAYNGLWIPPASQLIQQPGEGFHRGEEGGGGGGGKAEQPPQGSLLLCHLNRQRIL